MLIDRFTIKGCPGQVAPSETSLRKQMTDEKSRPAQLKLSSRSISAFIIFLTAWCPLQMSRFIPPITTYGLIGNESGSQTAGPFWRSRSLAHSIDQPL
jgi:hypothetical protein